jgi:hypothetical protein
MPHVAIALAALSGILLLTSLVFRRWRTFVLLTAFFAALNGYIAAPLHWKSFMGGHEFWLEAISPSTPPIALEKLALPTESPQEIILKMGCHVCHKIPTIPDSRFSNFCPVLIPKTMAPLRLTSPEYLAQVKTGLASATTPREYVKESILNPDAFIVPGFEKKDFPGESPMFHFYSKRFTKGALDVLADYLLTLDVDAAMRDGFIIGH